MCWTTRTQQPTMTLQIKIKLGGMCNLAIYDSSSGAVTAFICISFVCRKESKWGDRQKGH